MNFYTVFKRIINDKKFLISIITTATLFKDHLAGHLNSETENQGRKYQKETKPFGCYLSGQASHYTWLHLFWTELDNQELSGHRHKWGGMGRQGCQGTKKRKKKNTQDKKSNKTKAQQVGALEYCGQQLLLWGAEHLGPRSKDTGMQTEVTAGIE